jgi:hypothetical protein
VRRAQIHRLHRCPHASENRNQYHGMPASATAGSSVWPTSAAARRRTGGRPVVSWLSQPCSAPLRSSLCSLPSRCCSGGENGRRQHRAPFGPPITLPGQSDPPQPVRLREPRRPVAPVLDASLAVRGRPITAASNDVRPRSVPLAPSRYRTSSNAVRCATGPTAARSTCRSTRLSSRSTGRRQSRRTSNPARLQEFACRSDGVSPCRSKPVAGCRRSR